MKKPVTTQAFIQVFKSGYAAAPQKGGLPKLDEPLISQQDLEDYEKMEREEKSPSPSEAGDGFQSKVNDWMQQCFGEEISKDVTERNHRFIEEALELTQSTGATASECHQLVDYVFGRPVGETNQEIGGVMVTLAALCNAIALSMSKAGDIELARVWTKIDKIREKQANKPKHSPSPQSPSNP